jgi:predicted ester cyclase
MATEVPVNVRRLIEEGFSRGDLSVVDEVVAPDCIEHQRGLKPGADGVKDTISTLRRWFDDFSLTIEDAAVVGDMVWLRNKGRGIHAGSIMGNAPTGRAVEADVYDVVRVRDGLIVEHWGVPDQLGLLIQIGAFGRPQPAPVG